VHEGNVVMVEGGIVHDLKVSTLTNPMMHKNQYINCLVLFSYLKQLLVLEKCAVSR